MPDSMIAVAMSALGRSNDEEQVDALIDATVLAVERLRRLAPGGVTHA